MAKRNTLKKILVTGAGGHQGGAVTRALLQDGRFAVRAMLHHVDKPQAIELSQLGAQVVEGDFDEPVSLHEAMEGINGIFSIQDYRYVKYEGEVKQGKNVIDAAEEAGVKYLIYSSVGSANERTGIPHFDSKAAIENHLRVSKLHYTILRPVFFYYNYLAPIVADQLEQGYLAQPLSLATRLQQLCEDDYARMVVEVFAQPETFYGKEIDVAGVELTMAETVAKLSEGIGREIEYQQVGWDEFRKHTGDEMQIMYQWFDSHGYRADVDYLQNLLGPVTDLASYLKKRWTRQRHSA